MRHDACVAARRWREARRLSDRYGDAPRTDGRVRVRTQQHRGL